MHNLIINKAECINKRIAIHNNKHYNRRFKCKHKYCAEHNIEQIMVYKQFSVAEFFKKERCNCHCNTAGRAHNRIKNTIGGHILNAVNINPRKKYACCTFKKSDKTCNRSYPPMLIFENHKGAFNNTYLLYIS